MARDISVRGASRRKFGPGNRKSLGRVGGTSTAIGEEAHHWQVERSLGTQLPRKKTRSTSSKTHAPFDLTDFHDSTASSNRSERVFDDKKYSIVKIFDDVVD